MDFTAENRLPPLGVITKATRNQLRRLRLHPVPCYRCGVKLAPPRPVCFDDGHDSHLECSLSRNAELRSMRRVFEVQDAQEKGTMPPCQPLKRKTPMTRRAPRQRVLSPV